MKPMVLNFNLPKWNIEEASIVKNILSVLLDSKCLPDEPTVANNATVEEPKPAESKFCKGDKFRYKKNPGEVYIVDHITNDGKVFYWDKDADELSKGYIVNPDYIEPYTEPKEESPQMKPIESKVSVYLATKEEDEEFRQLLHNNGFKWNASMPLINFVGWSSSFEDSKIHCIYPNKTVTYCGEKTLNTLTFSEFKKQYFGEEDSPNVNNSYIDEIVAKSYLPDPAKQFDAILRDSFSKERRLNIAAMEMWGILANPHRKW